MYPCEGGAQAPDQVREECALLQAMRQRELVYNAQYQLAVAEHRVARASGERPADESAALTAALLEARAALGPAKAAHTDMVAALRTAETALGECMLRLEWEAIQAEVGGGAAHRRDRPG